MNKAIFLCILLISSINSKLNSKSSYDYSTYKSISENQALSGQTITSTSADESAVYITESISIKNSNINKDSGDSTKMEDSELYGVNSAVLVQGGNLVITGGQIVSKAKGANALYSTNDGVIVTSGTTITSTSSSISTLCASFEGSIHLQSSTVTSNGDSSPLALIEEEGSGIVFTDSTISSDGEGSDLAMTLSQEYGSIRFVNTKGIAEKSRIGTIDGKSALVLENQSEIKCSGNQIGNNVGECAILLYQSGSKFNSGNSFSCKDSTFGILESSTFYSTATMFFVSNTGANIQLTNCQLSYGSNTFIKVAAMEQWGEKGSNGGDAVIQLTNQNIEGDFLVDGDSKLYINLIKSNIKGKINPSNTGKIVSITMDRYSTITITGNSYCLMITNEIQDGSNLINGTYTWTIGTPIIDNYDKGIFGDKLFILGLSLLLNILLL